MPICWDCGEEIEFRYIDGRPTPIHIHGGWCSGSHSGSHTGKMGGGVVQICSLKSYIDPNALCPVCGEPVFFYQSPTGGRVFFDALGWPWPKHPCTDNKASQKGVIQTSGIQTGKFTFKNAQGDPMNVYELDGLKDADGKLYINFRRLKTNLVFRSSIQFEVLKKEGLTKKDFINAPSFVMKKQNDLEGSRVVEFICGRLKRVVQTVVQKEAT